MNNTFCLSIFMGLIFGLGLAWEFSAETTAIVLAQVAVAVICSQENQVRAHSLFGYEVDFFVR